MNRKTELRSIVLDIVFGRESVFFDPFHFGHLTAGVAQILHRREYGVDSSSEQRLNEEDWAFVQEIFWDLVIERVITIGADKMNSELPWFRLHSDAIRNAEKGGATQHV